MPVDRDQLSRAVRDLIGRYGVKAITVAEERVKSATKAGNVPALDLALLMLSEIERRLQGEGSDPAIR